MNEQLLKTTIAIQTLMTGLVARRHEEQGQTAAEYLGIVVVVAAIIAVLAQSSIGEDIASAIKSKISDIAGG
jgi:Flp pilus assembly pilin Flp